MADDAGSALFASYENDLKLVQADISQKLEQIPDLTGEPRKAAVSAAERALEEADELVSFTPEFHTVPTPLCVQINTPYFLH